MRFRLALLLAAIVPVLLIAGYTSYWFYVADAVQRGVDEWITVQGSNGVDVETSGLELSGYPLVMEAEARDVVMTNAEGVRWQTSGLHAEAQPWRLNQIDFSIDGPQLVTVPGTQPVTISADDGVGEVRIGGDGRLSAARIGVEDITILIPAIGDIKVDGLHLRSERKEGTETKGVAAGGSLSFIDLPVSPLPALGTTLDHAALDVTLVGPDLPELNIPYLTAWRDSDGRLLIDRIHFEWGPLKIQGWGSLTLDSALQPQGNLTAKVQGFLETVDALVEAGLLEADQSALYKSGLALLAGAPDSSGVATLTAPLSLKGGRLLLGPLQIAQLPPIPWR